ncbi:hypothetical protein [Aquimarina brevivitae]|uniref:Uncharacterized protein n=1 Tax=Aquimarina brevivitae TaxID=323412 RepID=A0A4V2F7K3_9FLAO|nr:hypothetical protein [Aquimarina brevivitae]RZT00120.1 hypothetical protein EV197_1353 [Aquimarina brevivitae]
MKVALVSFFTAIALTTCDTSENADVYYVTNNDIITVENETTEFALDESIYVITTVNDQQTTTNEKNITLSEFTYGEDFENFYHTLALYKKTGFGTLSKINLTENAIEVLEGEVSVSQGNLFVQNFYRDSAFRSKIGIKLLESGDYVLSSADYTNINNDGIILIKG